MGREETGQQQCQEVGVERAERYILPCKDNAGKGSEAGAGGAERRPGVKGRGVQDEVRTGGMARH